MANKKNNNTSNYWKNKFYKFRKTTRRNNAAFVKGVYKNVGPRGSDPSKAYWGADWATANEDQKIRRRAVAFKGAGDYRSVLRYGSRGVGAVAGGALGYMSGGYSGAIEGARSGYGAGAGFSKFMGWGDYSSNQIIDGGNNSQQAISVNQSNMTGDIYVEHTEFVNNVYASATAAGSSPFQQTKYSLNPGDSQTFPFLSQIAQNYLLYEFQGLIFQYKPTSGESGAASNSLGKIVMATNYDPTESNFLNSVQMENEDYANSTKPSCGAVHGIETHPAQGVVDMRYVRTGNVSRDLAFYDLGNFFLATEGIPFSAAGSQVVGELWVTYRVRLSRANLYGALLGLNIDQDVISFSSSAAALVNAVTFVKSSNTLGVTIANVFATAFTLTFPANITLGTYMIYVIYQDSVSFGGTQTAALSTNANNLVFWKPGSSTIATAISTDSATNSFRTPTTGVAANANISYLTWVTINAPGLAQASLQLNVSAALTANSSGRVFVTQYSQGAGTLLT